MNPAILLVLLLQIKHLICDGLLQTKEMVHSKGIYGKGLGILHSALHGAGTFVALAIFGTSLSLSIGIALADAVLHYHVDFIKENLTRMRGWTVADREFWWAQMTDQFIHNVTYLAIAAYVLSV